MNTSFRIMLEGSIQEVDPLATLAKRPRYSTRLILSRFGANGETVTLQPTPRDMDERGLPISLDHEPTMVGKLGAPLENVQGNCFVLQPSLPMRTRFPGRFQAGSGFLILEDGASMRASLRVQPMPDADIPAAWIPSLPDEWSPNSSSNWLLLARQVSWSGETFIDS